MFTLRMAKHSIKQGVNLFEILQDGEVVGAIYPTERGIKIVSRHLLVESPEKKIEIVRSKLLPIPAVLINLI